MISTNPIPRPDEIRRALDGFVIGQRKAKRAIASAFYDHMLKNVLREEGGFPRRPHSEHVLLLGKTGVGKTTLVRVLGDLFDIPVLFADATRFSQVGYVGDQVVNLLFDLRRMIPKGKPYVGIIFLDEFDKLRRSPRRDDIDVSGLGVQRELLTLLGGGRMKVRNRQGEECEVDTTGVLFLGCGAFEDLDEVRRERMSAKGLGFGAEKDRDESLPPVGPEDLIRYGFLPELIGRFGRIVELDPLGEEDLARILEHSDLSVLREQREFFAAHGIALEVEKGAVSEIARQAARLGVGARGLEQVVLARLEPLRFLLPRQAERGIRSCRVDRAFFRGEGSARWGRECAEGGAGYPSLNLLRRKALQGFEPALLWKEKRLHRWTAGGRGGGRDRRMLESLKKKVGFEECPAEVREWWTGQEMRNGKRRFRLIRVLRELLDLRVDLPALASCREETGSSDPEVNLSYLRYRIALIRAHGREGVDVFLERSRRRASQMRLWPGKGEAGGARSRGGGGEEPEGGPGEESGGGGETPF